jgi:hypothetical protein
MNGVAGQALQLDLFGDVVAAGKQAQAADLQRRIDGLTCLRDAVPEAIRVVTELAYTRREDRRSPSAAGGWAWCISRAGLRFESTAEWWSSARERGESWAGIGLRHDCSPGTNSPRTRPAARLKPERDQIRRAVLTLADELDQDAADLPAQRNTEPDQVTAIKGAVSSVRSALAQRLRETVGHA